MLPLFDTVRLVRPTDPPTSHRAAERIAPHRPQIRAQVGLLLAGAGAGLTHSELIRRYRELYRPDAPESSIRTRVAEAVREGHVEASGERGGETVWELTALGRVWVGRA